MGQSGREGCNILILNSKNINKNYMVQKKKNLQVSQCLPLISLIRIMNSVSSLLQVLWCFEFFCQANC